MYLQTENTGDSLTTAVTIDNAQKVGIGTSSPAELFDVAGNAVFSGSGGFTNVGIGTTSPSERLHIVQKTSGPTIRLEAKNYGGKIASFGYDSAAAYIVTGNPGSVIMYM